jgi:exopolysaccharide biosynthesis protein
VQVAINANFFFPFHANHPLSYYPHAGDRVQVAGFAAAEGRAYHEDSWNGATFYIARDGKVGFKKPAEGIWSAIAGSTFLVREGAVVGQPLKGEPELYARTALGLDVTGRELILVVVEGKQPGRSLGMSILELAEFMRSRGAYHAINLDGGGSSSLVRQLGASQWSLVNCTSNFKIPWWERPVANHLGVSARPK